MVFQWIFDGFLMGFKFWGAAPGGFFENPTIFGVFGLGFPSSGVWLVRWPLPLGRWPHSGDTVSCVFLFVPRKKKDYLSVFLSSRITIFLTVSPGGLF